MSRTSAATKYNLSSPTVLKYSNSTLGIANAHSQICSYIRSGKPVIVGLAKKTDSSDTHFVVAKGAAPQNAYVYIDDPGYYTDNTVLSQYTTDYYVYEIIVY